LAVNRIQLSQKGAFGDAENLNAVVGEDFVKSGNGESGAVQSGRFDAIIEPIVSGNDMHFQRSALFFQKFPD